MQVINSPKPSTFSRQQTHRAQSTQEKSPTIPELPKRSSFIKDHPKAFKVGPKISQRHNVDMALYRNLIPSEPINIVKGLQHRHQTLQIFQGHAEKEYVPEKITKSNNGINNQIAKNDSADRIKFLIERAKKDDDSNFYKKHKTRGTMYINELWGHKYEEKTVRAAAINKDIAIKEKNSWKPLQQHMDDLVNLYEKRHQKNYAIPTTSKIIALEDVSTPSMTLVREASRLSDFRPGTRGLKIQTDNFAGSSMEFGENPIFPVRHSSLPNVKRITLNNSEVTSIVNRDKEFSRADVEESPRDFSLKIVDRPGTKNFVAHINNVTASMPSSPKSSQYDKSFLMHTSSLPSSPLIKKKIDLQKNNLSKSSFLLKSHQRTSSQTSQPSQPDFSILHENPGKKHFLHHKNDSLNGLIDQCTQELEERPQLVSTMASMQKLFLNSKYDKKIRLEQNFRQKTIENCQDLFRLRLQSKKKMH